MATGQSGCECMQGAGVCVALSMHPLRMLHVGSSITKLSKRCGSLVKYVLRRLAIVVGAQVGDGCEGLCIRGGLKVALRPKAKTSLGENFIELN